MNLAKPKIILTIIVMLAAILRFWQLGTNPLSLTWDEASWGYNAYSLGIDGRDEFGRFLPFDYLESFGDFKPPMYAYLDIVPIWIFGLNEFAVRFPSALFGTLTVLVTYFLVKRLFFSTRINTSALALLSAFILAISPWHINLSRAAFEANIATFFLICGVWLFLCGVYERKWCLVLSIASFVLSLYTFNSARVVAPILVLILGIGFRKELLEQKKHAMIALVVGILLILPSLKFFLSSEANLRFREVNIFSDPKVIEIANQEIANDGNEWWSKIIHNRRFAYTVAYLRHYFDNFNPSFLFIKGDGNPKFSTQDVGQMYLWDLPFLVAGAFVLLRKREGCWWIISLWLIIGIIPAATARETPHALRIEAALPTFQILTAYGVFIFVNTISNINRRLNLGQIAKIPALPAGRQIKYLVLSLCFLFLIFNFLYYYHGYYAHYPREFSGEWQYGYKDSIEFVETIKDDFDQINVTTLLGRPYIYYLFYTKTHPEDFRRTAIVREDPYGFTHVDGFGAYKFGDDLSKLDNGNKRILYVNVSGRSPRKANIFKTVKLLNNDPVFTIYEIVHMPEEEKKNE